METIELSRPLLVNGRELTELPCDMDAVTSEQFIKAEAYARSKAPQKIFGIAESDYGFHLSLGFAGIVAADPSIDVSDLERISGRDLMKVMAQGRFFTGDYSETREEEDEGLEEGSSEAPSESSGENTTPAPSI